MPSWHDSMFKLFLLNGLTKNAEIPSIPRHSKMLYHSSRWQGSIPYNIKENFMKTLVRFALLLAALVILHTSEGRAASPA